jgi:cysteinyl-tRNA synthetase
MLVHKASASHPLTHSPSHVQRDHTSKPMTLYIYNTMTRRKEAFVPLEPGKVRMYVCGPTVYASAHIGHAMSAIVFDVIRRYLEYSGYTVQHVMNYTDVDDKIIVRAREQGLDPHALAQRYIDEFHAHLRALNLLPATTYPRATDEIGHIIEMVARLLESDYAYVADGDVYFRVEHDAGYGRLSGRRLDEMQAGARIEVDARKENPMDFALWKAAKPGEPSWDSPWGAGRPGWHIECSAMNLAHLGEQIDIHGGGNDLIFPHHENEIAQTESLTGKPFARYWVHNGMLQLGGEKMSKSLGNLVTIDDFLHEHGADALRFMILNASYRGPLTFTEEVAEQAERGLERLRGALRPATGAGADAAAGETLRAAAAEARARFVAAMDDDFNTAGALGHLFDLVKAINSARDAGAGPDVLGEGQALLRELCGVLGLTLEAPVAAEGAHAAAPFIELLIATRQELRKAKQYQLADNLRLKLVELGVLLEDGPQGTTWRFS